MLVLAFLGLFFVCFWFPSCILPVYPLGSLFFWILMHLLIYQKKKKIQNVLQQDKSNSSYETYEFLKGSRGSCLN